MDNNLKILCPVCDWEPHEYDRWRCHCGFIWNTFDTAARCPRCGMTHKYTQCRACSQMSLHIDWYRGLDDTLSDLLNEVKEKTKEPLDCDV